MKRTKHLFYVTDATVQFQQPVAKFRRLTTALADARTRADADPGKSVYILDADPALDSSPLGFVVAFTLATVVNLGGHREVVWS